ncbi:hypothetical protein [Dechloromonas sp. A34]|uniref:hypothetical protein n=1 Tax=Dechloromonas sp. A34 TaxID=447588 RepID=UPI0022497E68|nr:hypothetical protein [Dechloromonas sp. A34]
MTVTAGKVCSSAKTPSLAPSKPTTTAAPSGNNGLRRGATASEINEVEGDWAFNSGFLLFFTSVPLASQLGWLAGIKAGLPNMAFGQLSGAEAATEEPAGKSPQAASNAYLEDVAGGKFLAG